MNPPHDRGDPEDGDLVESAPACKVPKDVAEAVRTLIRWAGDDPDREGLRDTPRRVARASTNSRNSVSLSPKRIARCNAVRSSLKRPSISSTASRLLRKMSRHMIGLEAAMRVKSRKPEAENLMTSRWVCSSRPVAVPTMV